MIWSHGKAELKKFMLISNNYHSTIKFTISTDKNQVHLLDKILKEVRTTYKPDYIRNQLITNCIYLPLDHMYYL